MRIVQVIENYFPDSKGGTEGYVANVARLLVEAGHEVHIVAPSIKGASEYWHDGIQVHRFGIEKNGRKDEYKGIVAPKGIDDFLEVIIGIKPDVVHFNTFNRSVNSFHLKAAKELEIKAFLTPHTSGIFCVKGSLLNDSNRLCDGIVRNHDCVGCYMKSNNCSSLAILGAKILEAAVNCSNCLDRIIPAASFLKYNRLKEYNELNKWADGVIALSPWIEKALIANGLNNVTLVRQGISELMVSNPDSAYRPSERLKLIYVGRIYQIKNLEVLCDAIDLINSEKVELTIAGISGSDNYSRQIKSRLMNLPHLNWHENVPQNELSNLISQNDFLILTSISEMSPLVILESFANGVPVIATDIPPVRDNVEGGVNGLLFPVGDSIKLADILHTLIENIELRKSFRLNVRPPRTFQDVANELIELYKQ